MGHNNLNNDNDGNNGKDNDDDDDNFDDNDDNGKDDDDDDGKDDDDDDGKDNDGDVSVPPKMRPFFDLIRGFFPGLTFISCSSKNLNFFISSFFHSRVAN